MYIAVQAMYYIFVAFWGRFIESHVLWGSVRHSQSDFAVRLSPASYSAFGALENETT